MTVRQAAERLEISKSTVYLLVAEGKLACIRHGMGRGTIRIRECDIEAYLRLAERERQPERLRFIH